LSSENKQKWLSGLVAQWEGRLLRYSRRFVKNEVALELVQEAFVRIWNAEGTEGHEKQWLFRVCRNLAIDYLRKEKKVVLLEEEGVWLPQAEEALQAQDEESALQKCLASLSPAQKEVIRLKFQEDMSYKEISAVTGHSISHVGTLVHRAIQKIQKGMAARGER
jgi:RNA polymerase sigma factor (sigma-70 family)